MRINGTALRLSQGRITTRMSILGVSDFDADPNQRRAEIETQLNKVTALAEVGQLEQARALLMDTVLSRMDGHHGGNPSDDYVVTPGGQQLVYPIALDYQQKLNMVN